MDHVEKLVRRFPDLPLDPPDTGGLEPREAALGHAIVEAVIRRWLVLDYLIEQGLKMELEELEPRVRAILLCGAAQMLLLECPERVHRLCLAASGGLGRELNFWLKFAAFPYFVERFGQPFMRFATRRARSGTIRNAQSRVDVEALAQMNGLPGTARAFSRTVRDVISFRGQERLAHDRMDEIADFPPMAVLWGEEDAHIPIAHGRAMEARLEGVRFRAFEGSTHYLHHDDPEGFAAEVRAFLDDPNPASVRPREG